MDLQDRLDLIGDVHGCLAELRELLHCLGYTRDSQQGLLPPEGRHLVFVGDLVNRGPDIVGVLELAMQAVTAGHASCVLGSHDANLLQSLRVKRASAPNGDLTSSLTQLDQQPAWFLKQTALFLASLPARLFLDQRLLVVHAGDRPELSEPDRSVYNVYGRDTDKTDKYGYNLRDDWVENYNGNRLIVYGHTPVLEASWHKQTLNLDTGCVFGGKLTALRYPELTLTGVEARTDYAPSKRFNRRRR